MTVTTCPQEQAFDVTVQDIAVHVRDADKEKFSSISKVMKSQAGGPRTLNFARQGRQPRAGSRGSRSPCVAARSRARGRSRDVCHGSSQVTGGCQISSACDMFDDHSVNTLDLKLGLGDEVIQAANQDMAEEDVEVGLSFISSLLDDAIEDYTDEAVREVVFAVEAPVIYSVPEPPIAEEELNDLDAQEIQSEHDVFENNEVSDIENDEENDELQAVFSVFDSTALELTKATIDEATESFCQAMVKAAHLPNAYDDMDDEDAVTVLSDDCEEDERDQVAVVAEEMAREFVWEPPPELTPEAPEKVSSTAMETKPPAVDTLLPCSRCNFPRQLRPAEEGAPVSEEPFPGDCLPPSQMVAPTLAPRAEAIQFLLDVSTTFKTPFTYTTTTSTMLTDEANEKLCRALAVATLQQLWLRAPWQQQVLDKMAAAEVVAKVEATPPPPTPATAPVPPTAPPPGARTAAPRRRMIPTSVITQSSEEPAMVPVPPTSPPSRPQTAQPSMPPTSPSSRPRTAQHGGRPRRSYVAAADSTSCPTPVPSPPMGRPSRPGSRPSGMFATAPPSTTWQTAPEAPVAPPATIAAPSPASCESVTAPAKPPTQAGGSRRPCRPGVVAAADASNKGTATFRLDVTDMAGALAPVAPARSSSLSNSYQTLGSEFYCLSEDDAGSTKEKEEVTVVAKSPRQVLKAPRTSKSPRTAHMSPRTLERQVAQAPTALELDLGISSPRPAEAKPSTPRDALSSPRIIKAAGTGLLPMLPAAANSADSIAWSMGVGRVGSAKGGRKSFY